MGGIGRGLRRGRGSEARRRAQAQVLTLLDLVLALRQLLEVADDGAGRQVVEGLLPKVGVVRSAPLVARGLQLEAHLPL